MLVEIGFEDSHRFVTNKRRRFINRRTLSSEVIDKRVRERANLTSITVIVELHSLPCKSIARGSSSSWQEPF